MEKIIKSSWFEKLIIAVIVLNAVTLGLETNTGFSPDTLKFLKLIDRTFLVIFIVELLMKMWVYRSRFFSRRMEGF